MDWPSTPTRESIDLMNRDAEMIESGAMMRSWGWSVALHTAVWGLGFWLISQPVIVPQPIFQWEVSLISPSQQSSNDIPSSDASSQVDDRIRPVATKSAGKSAAAAPSVQSVIHRTEAAGEPVLAEEGTESTQSMVPVAVPNPSEADYSTTFPPSDMAAPPQTVGESQNDVDDEVQEPYASNGQSAAVTAQRADGSSDQPTQAELPPSIVAKASSLEARADFGWLMRMLWGRITERKRYPHEARMNQWEGRVIVRVVINEQGQLLDASVAMSSGYEVLDRAALEVIRESCPLTLSQPLGRERIVLRIPIQYKLSS
jgi:periplasmic protein TonB